MADQRMIHRSVICSDAYIELSFEAQALYIQLTLEADNFGFTGGVKRIMRSVGVQSAALDELVNAGFLLHFDSGTYAIKHWLMANGLFKSDRTYDSKFPLELSMVVVDYDLTYELQTESNRIPDGFQPDSPITIPSTSTTTTPSSRHHNVTQVIIKALQRQGIINAVASSSSSSTNPQEQIVDPDNDDTDDDHIPFEEYCEHMFPGKLKNLLSQWVGFSEISVNELRQLLGEGIAPEVIVWVADAATSGGASSPRSYFNAAIKDKRATQCTTVERLLDVEGKKPHDRARIIRFVEQCSKLKEQLYTEWSTTFEGGRQS